MLKQLIENKVNELNTAEQSARAKQDAEIARTDLLLRTLFKHIDEALSEYERPEFELGNYNGKSPAVPVVACGNKYHPDAPARDIQFEDYSKIVVSDLVLEHFTFCITNKYQSEERKFKNLAAEDVLQHVATYAAKKIKNGDWALKTK